MMKIGASTTRGMELIDLDVDRENVGSHAVAAERDADDDAGDRAGDEADERLLHGHPEMIPERPLGRAFGDPVDRAATTIALGIEKKNGSIQPMRAATSQPTRQATRMATRQNDARCGGDAHRLRGGRFDFRIGGARR